MFDHGSFYSDSNSSLGRDTAPGEYSVQSLHVQDRGDFELHSFDKELTSQLSLINLTVRILSRLLLKEICHDILSHFFDGLNYG